jgi:hypothetical protein
LIRGRKKEEERRKEWRREGRREETYASITCNKNSPTLFIQLSCVPLSTANPFHSGIFNGTYAVFASRLCPILFPCSFGTTLSTSSFGTPLFASNRAGTSYDESHSCRQASSSSEVLALGRGTWCEWNDPSMYSPWNCFGPDHPCEKRHTVNGTVC